MGATADEAVAFAPEIHVAYVLNLEAKSSESDMFYFTDHKRLSGVYWALSSLALLGRLDALPQERILSYVLSCHHPRVSLSLPFIDRNVGAGATSSTEERKTVDGAKSSSEEVSLAAFAGNTDQDPHLLYTLSGVQVLAMYDALDRIDQGAVVAYVAALQQEDGSFSGDMWGEVDSRFSYCALLTLAILGRLDAVDVEKAADYIVSCVNFDGGFGCIPGAESHAGQVFCCVGALKLCGAVDRIDGDLLGWWLCERQLECGGFNGRPDKKEDVCYSWWVLSSLAMLGKMSWIDGEKLTKFICDCQDEDDGGIADRPGDMPDVFHTFFGLAGLSLLGDKRLAGIDPMYALPDSVVARLRQAS
jgi:geranylgeranyl transferase type-2 subunit beta